MKTEIRPEEEMKDSGVKWIGAIPRSWKIEPIKRVVVNREGGAWGEEPDDSNKTIVCMRIADFNYSEGLFSNKAEEQLTKRKYTDNQIDKLLLQRGDILVEKSGGGEKTPVGRAVLFDKSYKALFANFMERLRFDSNTVTSTFAEYYWRCMYNKTVTTVYIKQTTGLQNLDIGTLLEKERIVLPRIDEQKYLCDYLNTRCEAIDLLSEEAKKSISEYESLKQSVISEAVLKGLEKKSSFLKTDEKWLPQIPINWRIERGKNLFYETNNRSTTGTEELLTVSQYTGITPRSQKNVNMFESLSLVDYKICEIGDIAANTMWMWAGAVGVSNYYGVISPSYNTYRQKGDNYDPAYLDYMLRTPEIVQEYASRSTGIRASRLRLYPSEFLTIKFPVPPKDEQIEIVSYLNKEIPSIDSLIKEKQSLISDLEAYKKSLIYECVTGKRKVVA